MLDTKKEYHPNDIVVVTATSGMADIANVVEISEERILAKSSSGQEYAIPIGDTMAYTGPKGRIFVYPTIPENVMDCQRIAALERSTVLRQITHFEREQTAEMRKLPIGKIAIIGIIVLLLIIFLAVK